MRFITLILILICILCHHDKEYEHKDDIHNTQQRNTETHYHPDPNLAELKGFHYHEQLTNESFWDPTEFKNIWEKLGFNKKDNITSEDFRKSLYHLTGFEDTNNMPATMKEIFDRYLKDLPEKINETDISKYFNVDKFFNNIKDYYNEQNQPTYYEQLMSRFRKGWRDVKDVFKHMFTNENTFCCSETDFDNIMKKLDLENKRRLDKTDIERIVRHLFTSQDAKYKIPEPVSDIINRIIERMPNDLHVDELRMELSYGKVMPIVKDVANKTCGESCFDKHKEHFEKGYIRHIFRNVFNYTHKHPEDL
jgi:hypothetical protein